jgi:excisionase family DNA binding protein
MALWRVEEAADFLGIRPKTLYEWVRQGRIPHRKIGFNVRFEPAELESWVASQSRGPESSDEEVAAESSPALQPAAHEPDAALAWTSKISADLQKLAGEAARTLRDLEHEVGAELSFPRRQELNALAGRLETAARVLAKKY